jgi:hypothetical protein
MVFILIIVPDAKITIAFTVHTFVIIFTNNYVCIEDQGDWFSLKLPLLHSLDNHLKWSNDLNLVTFEFLFLILKQGGYSFFISYLMLKSLI